MSGITQREYEDLYGDDYIEDEDNLYGKCNSCGANLIKVEEAREHFGTPCYETFYVCPNCD